MGRRSVKENKSIYQLTREERGLTREAAGDLMPGISAERIEKLENGRATLQPEDAVLMAECYKAPQLCNYYCAHECAVGRGRVDEIKEKSLATIAIEVFNGVHRVDKWNTRLLEIAEDDVVREDEVEDFVKIKDDLDKLAGSISSLQLWLDREIAEGQLNKADFEGDK